MRTPAPRPDHFADGYFLRSHCPGALLRFFNKELRALNAVWLRFNLRAIKILSTFASSNATDR